MGIGFAIPVTLAKDVMTAIIDHGKVVRGWLGVEVRGVDEDTAEALSGTRDGKGVAVAGVVRGGPAGNAGIQPGDLIQSINGARADSAAQVVSMIAGLKPGSDIKITVARKGRRIDTLVHIGERPPQKTQPE